MIILSNCFSKEDSEGCIKVAQSLAKRCRARGAARLISLDGESKYADESVKTNKLLLSSAMYRLLKDNREPVLYIPFSAGTKASILRIFLLSRMTRGSVKALFAGAKDTGSFFRWLLKASGAEVIALSEETCRYYSAFAKKTTYLQTGVDTVKFHPVTAEEKLALRRKYGIGEKETVLLHAGHMKPGRGLGCFAQLDQRYKILLVLSSVTRDSQDPALRAQLEACGHIRLIEDYLPDIQELYQLADVYVFPVTEKHNCIDTPLSVLEAMACGIPVAASDYGELKSLKGTRGLQILERFDKNTLEAGIEALLALEDNSLRQSVLKYDWNAAVDTLMN